MTSRSRWTDPVNLLRVAIDGPIAAERLRQGCAQPYTLMLARDYNRWVVYPAMRRAVTRVARMALRLLDGRRQVEKLR